LIYGAVMSVEGLHGESELRRIANAALEACDAEQAEVVIAGGVSSLTRFANNYIHQNVEERDTHVQVRAVIGKKIGIASTDMLTNEALQDLGRRAVALARLQADNPDFVSLPAPSPVPAVDAFDPATAAFAPEQRAEAVRQITSAAARESLIAAGAFRTERFEFAVANSLGVWAYHIGTSADINTVVMGETSSGHAETMTRAAADVDGAVLAAEAIDKCRRGANPRSLEPGTYPVILEEYAVADILDYFAYLSFGAQAFVEKRSFMSGRLGERVMGGNISIWDDGLSLDGIPAPFDAEGVPRQRVDFVRDGTAGDVVWDTYYGGRAGHPSTGHALPAGDTFGPVAANLFLAPGSATKDEMVSSIERGIWVSRFWYTRPVHPLNVILTGMTRDGTFLIEDGRIAGPIRNLRFTQSYLDAMNNVDIIARDTKLLPSSFGSWSWFGTFTRRVPALKIKAWDFTGATEF
jgi:PmbA protein